MSGSVVAGRVVEHAHLMITAGREKEFEKAFLDAHSILTGAAGCLEAELFRDSEEAGSYLLRVLWETLADHVEVFPGSPAGAEFGSKVAHFFASTPQVRHFDATAVNDRVGG